MREKKLHGLIEDLERSADFILQDFSDFTHGTRVLLLLQRGKEGGHQNSEHKRRAMRTVVHSEESLRRALIQMLALKATVNDGYRIYMTAAPRDLKKSQHKFKELMLDADYASEENRGYFWERLEDRWVSALVQTKPPKGESVFVIDVDTDSTNETLKEIAKLDIEVLKQYKTKNGWHLIVKPFNSELWSVKDTEIQKEGLLLLAY